MTAWSVALALGASAAGDPHCRLLEADTRYHGAFTGARAEPLVAERDEPPEAAAAPGATPGAAWLAVRSTVATPSVLPPGGRVRLVAVYGVAPGPTADRLRIREVRDIRRDGRLLATIAFECDRPAGTWVSTLPLVVPETAPGGTYQVTTGVSGVGTSGRAGTTFVVGDELERRGRDRR